MDALVTFNAVVIVVGFIVFLIYLQIQKERDANSPGPVVSRAATVTGPEPKTYFDAFFALAMKLSRSIPLSEWATGTPRDYNIREIMSIDETKQAIEELPFRTQSRFVLEPLEKLVAEIGLINSARETRESSEQFWEETCPPEEAVWGNNVPADELEDIVSTYLKAWLCNSNPFVLIELAYILIQVGRVTEAREALTVAQKFPVYARTRTMSQWETVAQSMAHQLIPPGPGREARSLGESLYSPKSLALLSEEADCVQKQLGDFVKRDVPSARATARLGSAGPSHGKRNASGFEVDTEVDPRPDPNQWPTADRVRELYQAWQEGKLDEALQSPKDQINHPNLSATRKASVGARPPLPTDARQSDDN